MLRETPCKPAGDHAGRTGATAEAVEARAAGCHTGGRPAGPHADMSPRYYDLVRAMIRIAETEHRPIQRRLWTAREIVWVKLYFAFTSHKAFSHAIGRSVNTIRQQAKKLRSTRRDVFGLKMQANS